MPSYPQVSSTERQEACNHADRPQQRQEPVIESEHVTAEPQQTPRKAERRQAGRQDRWRTGSLRMFRIDIFVIVIDGHNQNH